MFLDEDEAILAKKNFEEEFFDYPYFERFVRRTIRKLKEIDKDSYIENKEFFDYIIDALPGIFGSIIKFTWLSFRYPKEGCERICFFIPNQSNPDLIALFRVTICHNKLTEWWFEINDKRFEFYPLIDKRRNPLELIKCEKRYELE